MKSHYFTFADNGDGFCDADRPVTFPPLAAVMPNELQFYIFLIPKNTETIICNGRAAQEPSETPCTVHWINKAKSLH